MIASASAVLSTLPATAWLSSPSVMRSPPAGPAFCHCFQTMLEYRAAFLAFLLPRLVPSKLLCFANAKILTLAAVPWPNTNGSLMKIHEYQAKAILARYGVTTPRGEVAFTKEEAREGAHRLKSPIVVVKAQIHAGGRGKTGRGKLAQPPCQGRGNGSPLLRMNPGTSPNRPSCPLR